MPTIITTIQEGDLISGSRTDINNNFDSVLNNKIETSVLDTDTTLAANSDSKVATQKAVKTYVDAGGNVNASETTKGIVEEATDAEVTAGTATGATGAKLFVTPAKLATRGTVDIQNFEANGTWTKPTGAKYVTIICIGAGGGGSSSGGTDGGGGGGGGGLSRRSFPASILGSTETVTVGVGGTGGGSGTDGTDGGNTTFGAWVKAGGGQGGGWNSTLGAGGTGEGVGSVAVGAETVGIASVLGGASGGGRRQTGAGNGLVGGAASPFGAGGGGSARKDSGVGGAGGAQNYRGTAIAGGAAQAAPTNATQYEAIPGAGGGGGSDSARGGQGGLYGGGGGGGNNTDGGGNGAIGICQVITNL